MMLASFTTPIAVQPRRRLVARPRKPLTRRELEIAWPRIKARVLAGGMPFGVFVIKRGKSRVVRLISTNHHDYAAQMRVDKALHHWIGTYDGRADLGDLWEDLANFDK
ncbi:hypothetical protein D3C72_580230 [compost metagenome]